jgi:CheY-like chemotaxis protein
VLDRLKRNPRTRHIPVHVISVVDREQHAATINAFAYMEKPVTKEALEGALSHISDFIDRSVRMLLLVEDDSAQVIGISELFRPGDDVQLTVAHTGKEALEALAKSEFDCAILDLLLPDMDGIALLEQIKRDDRHRDLPVIVYTSKDLTPKEESRLKRYAGSVILKDGAHSPDRLVQEASLFLHRVHEKLPDGVKQFLDDVGHADAALSGRNVLVVDDDIRNIFAVTSVLESHHMNVVYANNGRKALEALESNDGIEVVLMDVMMPEMDGYETMRMIRKNPNYAKLPIIAVTAKALKDDRDKCLGAGASDYLPKPVDADHLVELLKLWIR